MQKCITTAVSNDLTVTYFKLATVTLVTFALYMALSDMAMATSPMGTVLCNVAGMIINGNLGRGVATLGIIVLGVGASIGKVSWGLAMTVGVGIAVALRANDIVGLLVTGATGCT